MKLIVIYGMALICDSTEGADSLHTTNLYQAMPSVRTKVTRQRVLLGFTASFPVQFIFYQMCCYSYVNLRCDLVKNFCFIFWMKTLEDRILWRKKCSLFKLYKKNPVMLRILTSEILNNVIYNEVF